MQILRSLAWFFSGGNPTAAKVTPETSPAEVMRELRRMVLSTRAAEAGFKPTAEYPKAFGVVMDLSISEGHTASVASLCDGNASLYTTGSFGVLGGIGHEAVRLAAMNFVYAAQPHHDNALPTADFPYPLADHVSFYLLGFESVRVIDVEIATLPLHSDGLSDLFGAGQRVLTELRLLAE
jgi:hypothetical protein